ncbi:dipeptidyl peptidase, partial [Acrasis kona]
MSRQTINQLLQDNRLKHYVTQESVPVVPLVVEEAFNGLSDKEKKYAHYISQASWAGTRIVLAQASHEAPAIFDFLQSFFRSLVPLEGSFTVDDLNKKINANETDLKNFLQYAVNFYGNLGNYKSFGDTKFIPRIERDALAKIVSTSSPDTIKLFEACVDAMYSLDEENLEIGFGKTTCSGYYTKDVTKEDAELVQGFLEQQDISAYNTRLFKTSDGFTVLLASATKLPSKTHQYKNVNITVEYGDYQQDMANIVKNLKLAQENALNDHESNMLLKYVESFDQGSIEAHKDSQRHWIKDKGPVVESNIGFIESYRDPLKVRGEWEGFVAVVNKETTKKFNALVDNAENFIAMLPWNHHTKAFEKDQFQRPDFTSLEVVTFASSGIPAGINIPNYDDIRQTEGFKNVSLGNVLNAPITQGADELSFLHESDHEKFKTLKGKAFEVQVGLHELLGHGSGKLLSSTNQENSQFNFDPSTTINPLTNKPVDTFYKYGETYPAKFSTISSSWEECRAEAVGIYLCVQEQVLNIFGFCDKELADDIVYVNWLNMVRAGLLGLEYYSPDSKQWGQAHMQARHAILRVLLRAGQGLVTL